MTTTDDPSNQETQSDEGAATKPGKAVGSEILDQSKLARDKRLESHESPFRGIGGKVYYLRQLFYLVFFLPGFFAGREAKKIVATGKGKVRGYNDLVYAYPLLPITLILVVLSSMITDQVALQVMGVIWALSLLVVLATIGEDVSGRMVGGLIGLIVAVAVAWVVLQATGSVEVSSGVWKFLQTFDPAFTPGIPLLVAFGVLVFLVYSSIKSNLAQVLHINGNRWSPSKLNTEATFDSENHRCYARTPDWLERAIFGCRDIHIIPILEARSVKAAELGEAAVFSLQNVPSGGLVYSAIEASAAATEVERVS
jgi:hypothetical protein